MSSTPTTAQQQFDCDRDVGFLDTTVFAVQALYDAPIDGIFCRQLDVVEEDTDRGRDREFRVWVSTDPTTGIELPRKGATLTLPGEVKAQIVRFETEQGVHVLTLRPAELDS